jgi:hypothetical protein
MSQGKDHTAKLYRIHNILQIKKTYRRCIPFKVKIQTVQTIGAIAGRRLGSVPSKVKYPIIHVIVVKNTRE